MMFFRVVFAVSFVLLLNDLQAFWEDGKADTEGSRRRTAPPTTNAYRVASFEVKGRWLGGLALPLHKGDLWTPEKQSEVLAVVQKAFDTEPSDSYLLNQTGEVGVLCVDVVEEKDEAEHTVKLIFRPLRVHLSFAKLGDNVLPIPRSAWATRYEAVPTPLLALHPGFGLSYDRAFGTALTGGFHNDLLTLPDAWSGRLPPAGSPNHLDARFDGSKSFESFYRADGGMSYAYRRLGRALQQIGVGLDYSGAKEPLAGQEHTDNAAGISGDTTLRIASHTRLSLNTGYRHASDLLEEGPLRERSDTQIQPNRLLVESLLPWPIGGFVRATVWEDQGWTDQGVGFHQRFVGRVGYAREIAVAPNQTIGLELISGGGILWGDAPASRRFFGGNSSGQFLYDGTFAADLMSLPAGPLIRSFGQGEAVGNGNRAARGGDSFWHVNINLTLPIPALSFPLIPAEDEVRHALKRAINTTGPNGLIKALRTQGMSRADALAEAERTFNEIRPATEFIIDEANLYSLKPLLMFDAAGLTGADTNPTWFAAGGGLQLTIVIAKLELGYMHTLSGPTAGDRGNLFLRLIFQNLF